MTTKQSFSKAAGGWARARMEIESGCRKCLLNATMVQRKGRRDDTLSGSLAEAAAGVHARVRVGDAPSERAVQALGVTYH